MEKKVFSREPNHSVLFSKVIRDIYDLLRSGIDSKEVPHWVIMKWNLADEEELGNRLYIYFTLLDQIHGIMRKGGESQEEADSLLNGFLSNLLNEMEVEDPDDAFPHSRFLS